MNSSPRLPSTRAGALLVLLLGFWLCAHPVLGSLAEMHELAEHAVQAGDAADDHDHAPPDDSGSTPRLHALLHLAHCCGHGACALPGATLLVATGLGPVSHDALPPPRVATVDPVNPFRPPISA